MSEQWRRVLKRRMKETSADDECVILQILMDQVTSHPENRLRGKHGGSRVGRKPNLSREREEGHERIFRDYFSPEPVYGEHLFRRRFRMSRRLFNRILDSLCTHDDYFIQKRDALGVKGLSSIQKATGALRMLAYGMSADSTDEYCRLGESTAMEAMKRYAAGVREIFEPQYLREPTKEELLQQMSINAERGFPGMFASIDCMKYVWKNCPVSWQGQFQDKDKHRSIILEAVADQSLWIWHAFFGVPGGNNDINVLDRSPLVRNLLSGDGAGITFQVGNNIYQKYYLLADGIYPKWTIFVQTIPEPQGEKRAWFAKVQESCRKDVERCFGVLQARFGIMQNPCRQWNPQTIRDIMIACVVLHNMIIEDERDSDLSQDYLFENRTVPQLSRGLTFSQFVAGTQQIENQSKHYKLRADLIDHLFLPASNHSLYLMKLLVLQLS